MFYSFQLLEYEHSLFLLKFLYDIKHSNLISKLYIYIKHFILYHLFSFCLLHLHLICFEINLFKVQNQVENDHLFSHRVHKKIKIPYLLMRRFPDRFHFDLNPFSLYLLYFHHFQSFPKFYLCLNIFMLYTLLHLMSF